LKYWSGPRCCRQKRRNPSGARQTSRGRRRSVVTARCGDAPRSLLALSPSASTRDPLPYFNRLQGKGNSELRNSSRARSVRLGRLGSRLHIGKIGVASSLYTLSDEIFRLSALLDFNVKCEDQTPIFCPKTESAPTVNRNIFSLVLPSCRKPIQSLIRPLAFAVRIDRNEQGIVSRT